MSMWRNSCYLIVVGTTANSFSEETSQYRLITSSPMDSEEKELCNADKNKSYLEKEPGVEIVRATTNNILPSVHSSVAAASPLFSSYRSIFQNWKHSVPKLYKYPSSDIEVVVYRKNGDVEKLSSCKTDINRNQPRIENDKSVATVASDSFGSSETEAEVVLQERVQAMTNAADSNTINKKRETCNENRISNLEKDKETPELKCVPLVENSNTPSAFSSNFNEEESICSTAKGLQLRIAAYGCENSMNSANEPNCEFIFKIKTFSNVPLLDRRLRKYSKDNCMQTLETTSQIHTATKTTQVASREFVIRRNAECQYDCDEVKVVTSDICTQTPEITVHIGTATKSTQVASREFVIRQHVECQYDCDEVETVTKDNCTQTLETTSQIHTATKSIQVVSRDFVIRQNAECQYDCDEVETVTNGTQTEMQQLQVSMMDFSQIFPNMSDAATQRDRYGTVTSSAQTSSTDDQMQTIGTQTPLPSPPQYTVDWHTNVPCCNVSNQTDPNILNLVKDYGCQAIPELASTFTYIDEDFASNMTSEVSTNTDSKEQTDVGIQLSASCCYFTKKREKKKYEAKLEALHNQIRSFYQNLQQNCENLPPCGSSEKFGKCKIGSNWDYSVAGAPGSSGGHLQSSKESTPELEDPGKTLEEAKKCLDDLDYEVDKLLDDASVLTTNLQSLDTSYFEDDWLQSSI